MFRKIPQFWGYFATHTRIYITRSIICTYVDIDYLPYKNTTQYYPFQKWWIGSDLYLPQISIRVHMYMIAAIHPWKWDYILNHLNKYLVNSHFSSKNQLNVPGHHLSINAAEQCKKCHNIKLLSTLLESRHLFIHIWFIKPIKRILDQIIILWLQIQGSQKNFSLSHLTSPISWTLVPLQSAMMILLALHHELSLSPLALFASYS